MKIGKRMIKKNITLRSLKVKITKLKKLLWECYIVLKHNCGEDGNDFLTGEEEKLKFLREGGEEELKIKVRKIFKNDR